MPLLGPPFYGWTQGVMRLRGYYQGLALETAPGPTCLGVDPGGHAAPSPTALPVMHDRIKVPIAHFSYSPIENSRIYKSERFRSRKDRCWLSSGLAASPGRVPLNVKEGIINCQAVKSTARFSHQTSGRSSLRACGLLRPLWVVKRFLVWAIRRRLLRWIEVFG
jgi:hypothetical protein